MRAPQALLDCIPCGSCVSISGAGGKTTLMFELARRLEGCCVTTTTTHVGAEQILAADRCYSLSEWLKAAELPKVSWVSETLPLEGRKVSGFDNTSFPILAEACRDRGLTLIYEADGAARRHLKAPAAHEPVIGSCTDVCIYLCGMDAIGCHLTDEYVHRPEIFSRLSGITEGERITPEAVVRVFSSPEGGLKEVPEKALPLFYLTHVDSAERVAFGNMVADGLTRLGFRTFLSE